MGLVLSFIRAANDVQTIENASTERIHSVLRRMECRFGVMFVVYTVSFLFLTLKSHVLNSLRRDFSDLYATVYLAFYGVFLVSMLLDVVLLGCPGRGASGVRRIRLVAASATCVVSALSYLTCKVLMIFVPYMRSDHFILPIEILVVFLLLTLVLCGYKLLCAVILHKICRRLDRAPPQALAAQGATAPMLGRPVPIAPTQAGLPVVVGVAVQS